MAPLCGASSFLVLRSLRRKTPKHNERVTMLASAKGLIQSLTWVLDPNMGVDYARAFRYYFFAALGTSTPALHEAVTRLGYVMAPLCGASLFLAT